MRRQNRCGYCGIRGHNRASCPDLKERRISQGQPEKKKNACSFCGDRGHTYSTCQLYKDAQIWYDQTTNEKRKEFSNYLNRLGVGLGSLVLTVTRNKFFYDYSGVQDKTSQQLSSILPTQIGNFADACSSSLADSYSYTWRIENLFGSDYFSALKLNENCSASLPVPVIVHGRDGHVTSILLDDQRTGGLAAAAGSDPLLDGAIDLTISLRRLLVNYGIEEQLVDAEIDKLLSLANKNGQLLLTITSKDKNSFGLGVVLPTDNGKRLATENASEYRKANLFRKIERGYRKFKIQGEYAFASFRDAWRQAHPKKDSISS